ncbi:MAG TPA: CBS domain-containing protein [Microlunatus sp.]|nr:CBS domain-containing protein [Microlunatus sp.]
MRASDLVVPVPTVTTDDSVSKAVRLMAQEQLPGLVVVDDANRPRYVLPGTQVLRLTVLRPYQDDPALARAIDEAHADVFWRELGHRTVGDCISTPANKLVSVTEDATLLEVATVMGRMRSPLIAVTNASGELVGAVTLTALLSCLAMD